MTEIESQIKKILAKTIIESDIVELFLSVKETITVDDLDKL